RPRARPAAETAAALGPGAGEVRAAGTPPGCEPAATPGGPVLGRIHPRGLVLLVATLDRAAAPAARPPARVRSHRRGSPGRRPPHLSRRQPRSDPALGGWRSAARDLGERGPAAGRLAVLTAPGALWSPPDRFPRPAHTYEQQQRQR